MSGQGNGPDPELGPLPGIGVVVPGQRKKDVNANSTKHRDQLSERSAPFHATENERIPNPNTETTAAVCAQFRSPPSDAVD
eukprot:409518-Rhodomonas_salina.2